MEASTATTCYRHPKRETGVACSACGRPICPDCMTSTPVGMRCPECARAKTQVRTMSDVQRPLVAEIIIGVCVVLFVAQLATRTSGVDSVTFRGGLIPIQVADGEWYRLITSGFLHYDRFPFGLLHIGFNMYFLYYLGTLLEPTLGHVRFAIAFFVCLLGGSLGAVLLSSPLSLTVGASGAVFGLIAVGLIDMYKRGIPIFRTDLGMLLILNLVITFALPRYISVGGHVGGLMAGAVVGYLLFYVERSRSKLWTPAVFGCIGLGVALAVAGVAAA